MSLRETLHTCLAPRAQSFSAETCTFILYTYVRMYIIKGSHSSPISTLVHFREMIAGSKDRLEPHSVHGVQDKLRSAKKTTSGKPGLRSIVGIHMLRT